MLTAWIILMLNSLVFTLRLAGNTGSFPRPLKPEEEQRYLALAAQGDTAARNTLVEHNLRLVAHIVKKCYPERREYNMALQRRACLPKSWEEGGYPLEHSVTNVETTSGLGFFSVSQFPKKIEIILFQFISRI